MDITILTKDLVAFLIPFLPYLLKAGEKAAEEAGKKLGGDAWERAKALWSRLQPKVEARSAAQEAVNDVVAAPQEEDAQAALRQQLKKILTENETLAVEVARLWEGVKTAGVTVSAIGERSIAIGGSVSSSPMVTGDQNKVDQG